MSELYDKISEAYFKSSAENTIDIIHNICIQEKIDLLEKLIAGFYDNGMTCN